MNTQANGTPKIIHFAKDNSMPYIVSIAPANNVFGGVPINVATPPSDAEYAIPSINALPKPKPPRDVSTPVPFNASATWYVIAIPIGTIIIAVAVLEIHIDKNPVATM